VKKKLVARNHEPGHLDEFRKLLLGKVIVEVQAGRGDEGDHLYLRLEDLHTGVREGVTVSVGSIYAELLFEKKPKKSV